MLIDKNGGMAATTGSKIGSVTNAMYGGGSKLNSTINRQAAASTVIQPPRANDPLLDEIKRIVM